MKPCSRKALATSGFLQAINVGPIIAKIQGSTEKLGEKYKNCIVVLYNKANLQPIAVRKPNQDGNYQFLGLNTDLKTFVVAFDSQKQYNAVVQDNVVPK